MVKSDMVTELAQDIMRQEAMVIATRKMHEITQKQLKEDLALAKRTKTLANARYKAWVVARKALRRAKARLSALPSQKRKYALEHMGEVIEGLKNVE